MRLEMVVPTLMQRILQARSYTTVSIFSAYDKIVEVLWNEFSDTIPQGLVERLAAILLGNTAVRKVFSQYRTDDGFDSTPEYDLLYTELTGTIRLVIDWNELPVLKARH